MAKVGIVSPSPIIGSGGVARIYRFAEALNRRGDECHLFVFDHGGNDAAELQQRAMKYYGTEDLTVFPHLEIGDDYDLLIATRWDTAKIVRDATSAKKAYIVQDYEAYFNPVGDASVFAENSYMYGLRPITYGNWLSQKLRTDFGNEPYTCDFCTDTRKFFCTSDMSERIRSVPPRVCFIYQGDKPRRCPRLGIESLGILKHRMPEVEVVFVGSKDMPELWYEAKNAGILTATELNDLYNTCWLGLCLSSSNPSCNPFDMMASGLPSVELYKESNLVDIPDEGVLLAHQTPESIAQAMISLLSNPSALVDMAEFGVAFMSNRSFNLETNQFLAAVSSILGDDNAKIENPLKRTYLRRPIVSEIDDNKYSLSNLALKQESGNPKQQVSLQPHSHRLGVSYSKQTKIDRELNCQICTVDVWDTLLRRECHPDLVKLDLCNHYLNQRYPFILPEYRDSSILLTIRQSAEGLLGRENLSLGLDDEYKHRQVLARWVSIAEGKSIDSRDPLIDSLERIEIEQEKRVIFADTESIDLLHSLKPQSVVFLSDFYMSSATLGELLLHAGVVEVKEGYSSADVGFNKRSGRLFDWVMNHFEVTPDQMVHIGDNSISDFSVPMSKGIFSVEYLPTLQSRKREELSYEFQSRPEALPKLIEKILSSEAQIDFPLRVSPLMFGYVLFVLENASRAGLQTVYFLTREGEIFKELYDLVAQSPIYSDYAPKAEILEVSRLATFGPSIESIHIDELMRLWSLYSTQSLHAMLVSLNVENPEFYRSFADELAIDFYEPIQYPWLDERIVQLFDRSDFVDALQRELSTNRDKLKKYLSSKGIGTDTKKVGLVDIGWRGTIQDNLAKVYPETTFEGYYLGLNSFLNSQLDNSKKFGYCVDLNKVEFEGAIEFFNRVAPLEMLFNSPNGSTVSYEIDGEVVRAIKEISLAENKVFEEYTKRFQVKLRDGVRKLVDGLLPHAVSSAELVPISHRIFIDIINQPDPEFSSAFFSLKHNEQFGVGGFVNKEQKIPLHVWIGAYFFRSVRHKLFEEINSMVWPNGFVSQQENRVLYSGLQWIGERKRQLRRLVRKSAE